MKEEVKKELARSKKTLESAKLLLENEYYEDAISRAYYAVLHAARAVLVLEGIRVNSHRAARRLFSQHLIKTGKIEIKYAKILNLEQDIRYRADYDSLYYAESEEAQDCFEDAKEFVKTMEEYIEKQ